MKIFFKFLWMGIAKLLMDILLIFPIAIGGITAWLLRNKVFILLALVFGVAIMILAYRIIFAILHAVAATKYCKENNVDSLKEAWSKTSWEDIF